MLCVTVEVSSNQQHVCDINLHIRVLPEWLYTQHSSSFYFISKEEPVLPCGFVVEKIDKVQCLLKASIHLEMSKQAVSI